METTLPMYFEQQFSGEISNVPWATMYFMLKLAKCIDPLKYCSKYIGSVVSILELQAVIQIH